MENEEECQESHVALKLYLKTLSVYAANQNPQNEQRMREAQKNYMEILEIEQRVREDLNSKLQKDPGILKFLLTGCLN